MREMTTSPMTWTRRPPSWDRSCKKRWVCRRLWPAPALAHSQEEDRGQADHAAEEDGGGRRERRQEVSQDQEGEDED